jgi:beta-RFAP synthase
MFRVQTGSRLHFGLLGLGEEGDCFPDRQGRACVPARRFGGVGMMLQSPGVVLRAEPAAAWSAEGPLAGRVLAFARRFGQGLADEGPPQRLVVEAAPREHVGLGVGTQLALATARAVAGAWGLDLPAAELARRVGRGERSALGVHGFAQGGFVVAAGKRAGTTLAPLAARLAFPPAWRVVLALPPGVGLHDAGERAAFARLPGRLATTEALCRLVLLGLLPALAEEDLPAFGEALFDFNARAGELFAPAQGGLYAHPLTAALVEFLRGEGVRGVGQSSWGPVVFAVVAADRAAHTAARVAGFLPPQAEVLVCAGCNHPAQAGPAC